MRNRWRNVVRAMALGACLVAAGGRGTAGPAAPAAPTAMPTDLTTGKTDSTPLGQPGGAHGATLTQDPFRPETPPQTVEGTLLSVDPSGTEATIRTKRDGDIKVGLPSNVYCTRNGKDSSVGEIKPGDRVWATVVIEGGNRAIRIVSAPPTSPMLSIIGIPVLLLIALGIWWTGRGHTPPIEPKKATPKAA